MNQSSTNGPHVDTCCSSEPLMVTPNPHFVNPHHDYGQRKLIDTQTVRTSTHIDRLNYKSAPLMLSVKADLGPNPPPHLYGFIITIVF